MGTWRRISKNKGYDFDILNEFVLSVVIDKKYLTEEQLKLLE